MSVTPMRAGNLFALASVEIDINGIQIAVRGIRALNAVGVTRTELPQYRDQNGALRPAISLLEEVVGPIGDAVLDELIERGLAKRRFVLPMASRNRRPSKSFASAPLTAIAVHSERNLLLAYPAPTACWSASPRRPGRHLAKVAA
jgi:hypothetical protein